MSHSNNCPPSPYPTKGEVIRSLYMAFGIKKLDKEMDKFARDGDYNYKLEARYVRHLNAELEKALGSMLSTKYRAYVRHLLKSYTSLVLAIPLDGIPRDKSISLVIEHFFCPVAIDIGSQINDGGFMAVLVQDRPLSELVDSLKRTIPDFKIAVGRLDKDWQDKLARWCASPNSPNAGLPDVGSLSLFITELVNNWPDGSAGKGEIRPLLASLLFPCVVLERCKRKASEYGVDIQLKIKEILGLDCPYDMGRALGLAQQNNNGNMHEYARVVVSAWQLLEGGRNPAEVKSAIQAARDLVKTCDPFGEGAYMVDWVEGRFKVLSGDLKGGVALYRGAMTNSLYRAGGNQKKIINEALALAAYCGDRPFLKRIKNQMIAFGLYQEPSYRHDTDLVNKQSRSKHDVVEDWEIRNWVKEFDQRFPKSKRFSSFEPLKTKFKPSMGPSIGALGPTIKLDVKRPNKLVNIGGIKMPQLVYFTIANDAASVALLLEHGADIDMSSEAGVTPILRSIIDMMPFEDFVSMSSACFDVISNYPHKQETLDKIIIKNRLSVMNCAVETGRYEVVKKVISLGADVNHVSGLLGFSPLVCAISFLGKVSNPKKAKTDLLSIRPNLEVFDAARRSSNGLVGSDFTAFSKDFSSPKMEFIVEQIIDFKINSLVENSSVESMRKIIRELLLRGANPDFRYRKNGLENYTPLMLAAEINDSWSIELLLEYGANPKVTDGHGRTARQVAMGWKSRAAVRALG